MKTCPVCALDLEDSYLFCPDDGSSLEVLRILPADSEPPEVKSEGPLNGEQTPGAVVLYCPACAAEYPLTFSVCPMHQVPLVKHRIVRGSNEEPHLGERDRTIEKQSNPEGLQVQHHHYKPARQLTNLELKRPEIESSKVAKAIATIHHESSENVTETEAPAGNKTSEPRVVAIPSLDSREPVLDLRDHGVEHPGFRVAAIATVLLLALLGVVAMYKVGSGLSRRSSPTPIETASKTEPTPQPSPFVATPPEALNYKDEPAPETTPLLLEPQSERPVERAHNESLSSSTAERVARKNVIQVPPKQPAAPPPALSKSDRVSSPPMPLPRGNAEGFDARLIRVRSMKTAAGIRYDLTFNMQEQAGRSAQWQRVLVSTRSTSGTSHSEAIPFSHRLGAAGALTFTISVELTGRSEADWRGRIVCTTLGWDNKGAPLQASFGANVTP